MKMILLSLLVLLVAVAQMSAGPYEIPKLEPESSEEAVDNTFDDIVIMRFTGSHEPQMVEITDPQQRAILTQIANINMTKRLKINQNLLIKFLKQAGVQIAKAVCRHFVLNQGTFCHHCALGSTDQISSGSNQHVLLNSFRILSIC